MYEELPTFVISSIRCITMFETLLILAVILFLSHIVLNYFKGVKSSIPGPTPWPIIGNMHLLILKDSKKVFTELKKKFGDIVYLTLGTQSVVVCFGYQMNNKVLVENSDKTKFRPMWLRSFRKLLPEDRGVVYCNGQQWTDCRKFTMTGLKYLDGTNMMEKEILDEINYLTDKITQCKSGPVPICDLFLKTSANVVSRVLMNMRFEYDDPKYDRLLESFTYVIEHNLPLKADNFFPILKIFKRKGQFDEMVKRIKEIRDLVETRIEYLKESFDSNNLRNFLDICMEEEKNTKSKVSEGRLIMTVLDMYFAGTDTSAVSLQWCFLYMLKFPTIAQKCRDEIYKVIGTNRLPRISDRAQLPYTNATLHEIQRIQTTIPIAVPHGTYEDLHIDGKLIPKNTVLLCDLASIHLDPTVWEEPEKFIPERFLGDDGNFKSRKEFCAFSYGPRQCLGKQLAETEVFLFFVAIVQRFKFSKAEPDQILSVQGTQTFVTYNPKPYEIRFQLMD